MDWQPIETAPKEGACLVWGIWQGEIAPRDSEPSLHVAERVGVAWCVTGSDTYSADVLATHWMPLPDPPAAP